MSYLLVLLILLIVAGLVALAFVPRGRRRDDLDITGRDERPPAHPDAPLPGSATRRHEQGKP